MKTYDSIVIGAGVAGLSVARELAKLGEKVLILEKDEAGGKASRAAAGTLDPYTEASKETPLFQIGLKALEFYPAFLKEIETRAALKTEYEKLGFIHLAFTPEDEKVLKGRFEWQKKHGLPVEALSQEEVRQKAPMVSPRVRCGFFYPEIPKVNAGKLTETLLQATRSHGVEIRTFVKNVSVWMEKKKLKGVKIPEEKLAAGAVVLAGGSWTGLDPELDLEIKVKPVRGQILLLRSTPSLHPRHVLHSNRYAYIVPWPNGRLLIGSTLEFDAGFEPRVTSEGEQGILERVSEIVDRIQSLPIESSWAGLRPYVEGGMPVIGPTPISGFFLATGYYRSGILIGPLAGKLLAEGIHSGKFSPLTQPFFYQGASR